MSTPEPASGTARGLAPAISRVVVRIGRHDVTGTALTTRDGTHGPQTLVHADGRLAWVPSDQVAPVDLPDQPAGSSTA